MKKILTIVMISFLVACTSAPRYRYNEPGISKAGRKNPALLIPGVQNTAIFTASFYGQQDGFDGQKTANGEIFNKNDMTAAHKTLPFGTVLKITYPVTGKSVTVRINDRGPFVPGRDIDLSYGAAKQLGLVGEGVGKVKVTLIKWGSEETGTHE
jgi:rare lipoprotein A